MRNTDRLNRQKITDVNNNNKVIDITNAIVVPNKKSLTYKLRMMFRGSDK